MSRAKPSKARQQERRDSAPAHHPESYFRLSREPLHMLVFLLPLVVLHQIGSAVYLTDPNSGAVETIRAQSLMARFFELFGAGGLYLPGLLLVVVLFVWKLLTPGRWSVRARVIGGMFLESLAWSLPLLVLWQLVADIAPPLAAGALAATTLPNPPEPGAGAGSLGRLTIAIGAGLYEELLFRLCAIALIHAILADGLRLGSITSGAVAVIISAALFALYHDAPFLSETVIDWASLTFFFLAGVYFGALYLIRGFGIVVAAHALYDVVALVIAPALAQTTVWP